MLTPVETLTAILASFSDDTQTACCKDMKVQLQYLVETSYKNLHKFLGAAGLYKIGIIKTVMITQAVILWKCPVAYLSLTAPVLLTNQLTLVRDRTV